MNIFSKKNIHLITLPYFCGIICFLFIRENCSLHLNNFLNFEIFKIQKMNFFILFSFIFISVLNIVCFLFYFKFTAIAHLIYFTLFFKHVCFGQSLCPVYGEYTYPFNGTYTIPKGVVT